MQFNIPDHFIDNKTFPYKGNKNLGFIGYKHNNNNIKTHVLSKTNLFVFIDAGLKKIVGYDIKEHLQSGESFLLKKGNYLMNEKMPNDAKEFRSCILFFSDEVLLKIMRMQLLTQNEAKYQQINFCKIELSNSILQCIESINFYADENLENKVLENLLFIKLQELIVLLLSSKNYKTVNNFISSVLRTKSFSLLELMESHFKENLQLQELAFLYCQSLSTFKRNFEKEFNTSPAEWIKNRRLQEAHYLLLNSIKSISDIAFEIGFDNSSHFIKIFKDKFNCTPKQLQKERNAVFFEP